MPMTLRFYMMVGKTRLWFRYTSQLDLSMLMPNVHGLDHIDDQDFEKVQCSNISLS